MQPNGDKARKRLATDNTYPVRRQAAECIKLVADHYELGALFDRQRFDGSDPRYSVVIGREVRFFMEPGDRARRTAVTVIMHEPRHGQATVEIDRMEDLIRSFRRGDWHPQEHGIPQRHRRAEGPEVTAVVEMPPLTKVVPRRRRRPSEALYWYGKPRVKGALE